MVKGYTQEYGIDYTDVFAPVDRMDIMRMIMLSRLKGVRNCIS